MPRPELYPVKKVVGFDQAMIDAIEKWRGKQSPIPNVSEAIRRLVEVALQVSAKDPHKKLAVKHAVVASSPAAKMIKAAGLDKTSRKSAEMAGAAIDRIDDVSASAEDRARRKRQLIKGPTEFREMRGKKPKA
jgi:hypothetical protein